MQQLENTPQFGIRRRLGWLGVALVLGACNAARQPPLKPKPAAVVPAGTVERVEGRVTAQRTGQPPPPRPLVAHAQVWPDDTVTTAADASVGIRLARNGALWELQGGQTRRVDQGLAWKAARAVPAAALADAPEKPATASAGRHSEQEAAQSAEAAVRPTLVPDALAPPVPAKPKPAHGKPRPDRQTEDFAERKPPRGPHGSVDGGSQAVLGALSPDAVQRFLLPLRPRIGRCYSRYLADHPEVAGRVVLQVVFGADGRVASATAQSATLPAQVLTCIEAVVKRAPKSHLRSVSVQVPFIFKSVQ